MKESEGQISLEEKRMELVEKIAEELGQLSELDPQSEKAKSLKLSIGHLQSSLAEIEATLGYGKKAA